jgi:hypothetical protein
MDLDHLCGLSELRQMKAMTWESARPELPQPAFGCLAARRGADEQMRTEEGQSGPQRLLTGVAATVVRKPRIP